MLIALPAGGGVGGVSDGGTAAPGRTEATSHGKLSCTFFVFPL